MSCIEGALSKASAVSDSVDKGGGLTRIGKVWFVSTKDGATWITNLDPRTTETGGLILPLNDKARKKSETVPMDAPAWAYAGITDNHPGAKASRTCAQGK
jgi:hypothetical protein